MFRLISTSTLAILAIAAAAQKISADEAQLGQVVCYDGKRNGKPVWDPVRDARPGYCKLSGAGKRLYRQTFAKSGVVLF